MKRLILSVIVCAVGVSLFTMNAFAEPQLKFFGVATDGQMLRVNFFLSNLGVRLALNDHQRAQVEDILSDCHDRVVVIRREHPRDFDRYCRTRYNDTDRRIIALLTPTQLREYRHYRTDVHRWVHEQREWRDNDRDRHEVRVAHVEPRHDNGHDRGHDR